MSAECQSKFSAAARAAAAAVRFLRPRFMRQACSLSLSVHAIGRPAGRPARPTARQQVSRIMTFSGICLAAAGACHARPLAGWASQSGQQSHVIASMSSGPPPIRHVHTYRWPWHDMLMAVRAGWPTPPPAGHPCGCDAGSESSLAVCSAAVGGSRGC